MRASRWAVVAGGVAVLAALAGELSIGANAPDFTLNDLGGKARKLSAHKGKAKAVVLVWSSTQCRSGVAYQQRIQALHEEFGQRGVAVYGINSNRSESVEDLRAYLREKKLTYTMLKDPRNKVADAYGAVCTSEVFVLDGRLKLRYHGAFDNSVDPDGVEPGKRFARSAVLAILAGKTPEPASTAPMGCAIDRE